LNRLRNSEIKQVTFTDAEFAANQDWMRDASATNSCSGVQQEVATQAARQTDAEVLAAIVTCRSESLLKESNRATPCAAK